MNFKKLLVTLTVLASLLTSTAAFAYYGYSFKGKNGYTIYNFGGGHYGYSHAGRNGYRYYNSYPSTHRVYSPSINFIYNAPPPPQPVINYNEPDYVDFGNGNYGYFYPDGHYVMYESN